LCSMISPFRYLGMSELLKSTPSELFVLKRCIELRCPLCDGCENGVIDVKFGTYWMRCIRVDGTTFVLHYAPIRTPGGVVDLCAAVFHIS
jgi:hypothetical protein